MRVRVRLFNASVLAYFYFMRYQHSMADIILFQFWLLGLHEHLITITKAARRSPQVVSVWNFLMSSRVRAGLRYPFCSVIVHATMLEPPLVSGERGPHGLQGQRLLHGLPLPPHPGGPVDCSGCLWFEASFGLQNNLVQFMLVILDYITPFCLVTVL